ncbi:MULTISPECIES: LysR family transcriptional regulator [unclassified Mesorhizobium]|uniref:LysR family transcriptional regulator n=1 Tax=unclassified Mesorhizobium TaxID=325217 RepID=UPI00115E4C38|nr:MULTISPECIES: LysR family transcriptional regulator [unclassified Mesorhizobium]TRC90226.1 LysR family transcriptional regulator [Mesorhizobium sp. WSM4310]TRD03353.1 LysR family transcriptional regulator [Mesorhizobium sp. WSM4305]
MDRLSMLSCFVRVAESGSFSAAARDLQRAQSAVSQQIRALETQLQTRLFDRTTRKVALTEAGALYLQHVRGVLERMEEADQIVSDLDAGITGRLAVSAPVSFGTQILGAYLFQFREEHPGIDLDVSLSDRFVDLAADGLDLAVRMGPVTESQLIVRKIGLLKRSLAATPQYLDGHGRPSHPADLKHHDYVVRSYLEGAEQIRLTRSAEVTEVLVKPVLRSDNSHLICEAIVAGMGIGLVHDVLLDPMIASGTLERVLPDWRHEPQVIQAVYLSNRYVPRKVRAFVEGLARFLRTRGALAE